MKKLLLIILILLGLTSCAEEPLQSNEIEKGVFTGKVIYKTTEINAYPNYSTSTYYVLLLENDKVIMTTLPLWYKTQIGDIIFYENYSFYDYKYKQVRGDKYGN